MKIDTWLRDFSPAVNLTRLFSLFTVYKSSDPVREQQIVGNVAGYGDQLNRVVDALNVLVTAELRSDSHRLPGERKALHAFSDMADEIAKYKQEGPAAKEESLTGFADSMLKSGIVNRFVDALEYTKKYDTRAYDSIRCRLLELLEVDQRPGKVK